jgi:hypothetical protein
MQSIENQKSRSFKTINFNIFEARIIKFFNKINCVQITTSNCTAQNKYEIWKQILVNTPAFEWLSLNNISKFGDKNTENISKLNIEHIITMYNNFQNFCNANKLKEDAHNYVNINNNRKIFQGFFEGIFGENIRTEKLFLSNVKATRRLDTIAKLITPMSACSAIAIYDKTIYLSINILSGHANNANEIPETIYNNCKLLSEILKSISGNNSLKLGIKKYKEQIFPSLDKKIPYTDQNLEFKFKKLASYFSNNDKNLDTYQILSCGFSGGMAEHAEQKLCKKLLDIGATGQIAIGISKPCCFTCADQIASVNLTNNKIEFLISATHSSYIKTVACSLSAEQIYYPNQLPACDLEYNFSDFTSQVEENKNSNSKRMLEDTQTKLIKSIMSSDSWIPKSSFLFTLLKKRFDTNYRKGISVSDNKLPKRDMPEVSEFSLFSANENIISPEDIKNQNLKTHSDKTDKIQSKRNLAEALGISSIVKKLDF